MTTTVTAIVIAYDGAHEALASLVSSLKAQTLPPTQIVCVDQSPDGRFAERLRDEPEVEVLAIPENLGYPSACNRAALSATGEYLMFINPDAEAGASCLAELASVLNDQPDAAIAGAQVLLPDRESVNAGDNVLHLSGLAWSGRYGLPAEAGPPRAAAAVSGAAMMVRRAVFQAVRGYTEGFFMYYDDVDLAWRVQLAGRDVLFCPRARVIHDYEFAKGGYKWRYLERNRWWCLLAHLEVRTLLALLPLLAAVECAVLLRALREGWAAEKLASWRMLWNSRHALRARRREIQSSRRCTDRVIVERMSARVDSPFLASPALSRLDPLLRGYRSLILAVARSRPA